MRTIILLALLGATMSAPLIPQRLLSASNSNELLMNLNNAQLQPLQLQAQAQIPGLSQFSLSTVDRFAGLLPNQVLLPAQGTQVRQLDHSQPQIPPQTQQGPNQVMPYVFSFKVPQEQAQMLQYYPVYLLLPWEQPQQTVVQSPPQTGQQLFEEQMPFYTQFGYIPLQAEPVELSMFNRTPGPSREHQVIPGGQQQLALDPFIGAAPEIAVMPAGGVIPNLQKEMTNFKPASAGIFIPSTSQKPSTTNYFTSAINPTIAPELMEKKRKRCGGASDIILGYLLPQC